MTKLMASAYLMFKLICQRIDLDPELVLVMWRNRPAIEIYEPGPSARPNQRIKIFSYAHSDVAAGYPFKWSATATAVQWPYNGRPSHL